MKNSIKKISILLIVLTFFTSLNAEEKKEKFVVTCDEAVSYSKITRLLQQEEKSNYIYEDYMLGLSVCLKTDYFNPFNPFQRFAFYTPFSTEFNNVEQKRIRFNWAIDSFTGIEHEAKIKDVLSIQFGPGLHFLYEYSDRFDYINIGIGGYINCNLPVSYGWSIVFSGVGSFDFGNIGSNRLFEYYNYVWQWQTDIGFRYSMKSPNTINYAKQTKKDIEDKKNIKKEIKEAKKSKQKKEK